MLALFLKFILSHIIGDFVLQNKKLVYKRRENVFYLLLHVSIHAVVMALLFWQELPIYWMSIVFVSCAHLAIDSAKIGVERVWNTKPTLLFVTDQILHVLVIAGVVLYNFGFPNYIFDQLFSDRAMLYLIAFLSVTIVSPIFMRVFFMKWNTENEFQQKRSTTLIDAGTLIGIMERLIIVFFIQIGLLEGIGFLLAAKSIFRFGDLTNAKDTKFTEYVLVGTFLSFIIAIGIGFLLKFALEYV